MSEINIQTLFAQLRLEHLLVYLPTKGWQSAPGFQPDRVRFELGDDDTPYVVSLPRSNGTSQSRRLLQAAIYILCDVEDRQPAEIIQEMLVLELPTNAQVPAGDGSVRLRLSNNNPKQPIALRLGSRPGESVLMPGEAIEILADPTQTGMYEITIKTVGE